MQLKIEREVVGESLNVTLSGAFDMEGVSTLLTGLDTHFNHRD